MAELHNPLVTPSILSITTGINLKTTGATTLYTVPAGRKALVMRTFVVCTAATLYTVGATVDVGSNSASWNDISSANILTATTADTFDELIDTTPVTLAPASGTIKINITSGATATTATGTVVLIGILI